MFELIKKTLLTGVGLAVMTKDKIEEATKKLVDQAKISREDAQKLADELVELGEQRWTDLEKAVTEITRKGMDSLDICRQSDLRDLIAKIEALEQRLSTVEASEQPKAE